MFGKKKLYKIIYQTFTNYVTVIATKDVSQIFSISLFTGDIFTGQHGNN
jgi:hypothetical protein